MLFEAHDLSVCAGAKLLLRGVHFSLNSGELVALRGPSGCGKSTLLRALCALDDCSGEILLEGRTAGEWTYPLFRRRVLLLEQRPLLFEETIEANLRRPFAYRSSERKFSAARAKELMARLGLGEVAFDFAARQLSQGQQQRVALVRALLLEPKVVLLDEPSSALDAESCGTFEQLLRDEAQNGLAVLVVTHDAAQAARCCGREIDVTQWSV
jgi:ABC-type iron transport system FetAB ATPase subunit